MKKIAVISLVMGYMITSCGKSHSSSNYIRFQIGSNSFSFDSIAAYIDTTAGTILVVKIDAANNNSNSHLEIELQTLTKTAEGIYSRLNPVPTDHVLVTFDFVQISGSNVITYSVEGGPFTLSLDSKSGNHLKGQFSGMAAILTGSDNASITNGSFDIPFIYKPL